MVFDLSSLAAQPSVRGCRGGGVIRVGDSAMEDCERGFLELPHSFTRRLGGESRPGRLSMADSIFGAVLSGLRTDLARTMGAQCVAQLCYHNFAVADDVLSCVEARVFSSGDGLA